MTKTSDPTAARPPFSARLGEARGFSILELLLVLAVIIILATMAGMQAARAQRNFRIANAEREFTSYLEKARVDSMRRRARTAAEQASVSIDAAQPDRYTVTMDFGRGMTTRVIRLPQGVTFNTANNIAISFDWRGRSTAANDLNVSLTNGETTTAAMRVRRSGDLMNTNQSYYNPSSVSVTLNNPSLTSTTNTNARTQMSTAAATAGATALPNY